MPNNLTLSSVNIDKIANDLFNLEGSTTYFLEHLSNTVIQVDIQAQQIEKKADQSVLKRTVLMYTHKSNLPALFCESELLTSVLNEKELYLLMHTSIPIGKLFKMLNLNQNIRKTCVSVNSVERKDIQQILNLNTSLIYDKSYNLIVGERNIGVIKEYFTKESLLRLWNI